MNEKDRVRLTYDHAATGTLWRVGPEVSEIKFDDGRFRYVPNNSLEKQTNILPTKCDADKSFTTPAHSASAATNEEPTPMTKKTKPAAKKAKPEPTTKEEKIFAEFGLRHGTNYARMMLHLIDNIGTPVPVVELSKASYKDAQHSARVATMAKLVQERIIAKKRLPYEITITKTDEEKTIGLHAK